ncbi:hypothetical protein CMEL01_10095 [Colletotrichum melonis]|uniref:Uncharacterized protein n=1 Tax=Colletotrichum melonis TaxID=1209925 RepID=A0AAI9XED9_9PEZI|nr:hypothetical protein CMEL01_10095 [Colletotrichum melonis]
MPPRQLATRGSLGKKAQIVKRSHPNALTCPQLPRPQAPQSMTPCFEPGV